MFTLTTKSIIQSKTTILSSEFLCFIKKCESVSEAQTLQKQLREEHPKANHHCLAYRIGAESVQEFASDDGEPSGTAGLPMLNVLKRKELTQTCAIVVRYFGGTKLGKKGLIDAYRDSVELGLESVEVKTIQKRAHVDISYSYDLTNEVQKIFHELSIQIENELYGEKVHQKISFPSIDEESCLNRLLILLNDGLTISETEYYFD